MKEKILLGAIGFVLIIITVVLISTKLLFINVNDDIYEINVYYIFTPTNQLINEKSTITLSENKYENIENVINLLKNAPEKQGISSAIPLNLEILNYNLNNSILEINFSENYNSLKESEEIFLRAALVWTFTDLDFISGIKIFINNEPLRNSDNHEIGVLNRSNVLINPTIDPDKTNTVSVELYFSDLMGMYLVSETRVIEVKQSESIESQIMEQLILGPKGETLFSTIPSETKIKNIKTEEGICYVDLSNEFSTKHSGGSSAEILTIYSIVNSLTSLENVDSVQFLIEGEKVNTFGQLDISKPFERNNDLISI